jgi:shikimate dehydrogenase
MKLGLIGHPLGHSWSPEIHAFMIHEAYQKWDLADDEFISFMQKKDFDGINVTIPYKEKVIPYLDALDPSAEAVGAVNCIVNQNGSLKGYNTDALGFAQMLAADQCDVKGKKIALLGTGGASKAAAYALQEMGARVQKVSRRQKPDCIDYEQLYQKEAEFQCIVNATPVGMAPHTDESPIDLSAFAKLDDVIDIVANPLRTKLMFDAKMRGIPYIGGFEMLVRQAFAADELFTGKKLDPVLIQACMNALFQKKRNLVLIGMPTCGKSTLAGVLSQMTHRRAIEMDDEIVQKIGMPIKDYFALKGEPEFRRIEQSTAENLQNEQGCIISCGGGIVVSPKAMQALSANGLIIWIQRDLDHLFASDSRPLSGDEEYMKTLYQKREPLYQKYSDVTVWNNTGLEEAAHQILKAAGEEEI